MVLELVNKLPYDHPYRWDGTAVGGHKLWRPDELGASLALWLDAEDAASITLNGSNVSQWSDKSGNGNHAVQATAASQPVYNTTAFNSKPVVQFNGTSHFMSTGTASLQQTALNVFLLGNFTDSNYVIGKYDAGSNQREWLLAAGEYLVQENLNSFNANTNATGTAVSGNNLVEGILANGTQAELWANGALRSTAITAITSIDVGTAPLLLGKYQTLFTNSDISEVVITNTPISTTDRQKLEGYLAWKWGLESNLPIGHLYKSAPPTIGVPALDSDAQAYISAVETADGQALETGVRSAINDFVVGCKTDGIWNAIKSSAILAGARTLSGALQPLAGTAPTNFNFVSGDYNRKTGLVGDGSTKYLDSNRNNNADPQNNAHLACHITTIAPLSACYIGTNQSVGGGSFILRNTNVGLILQTRGSDDNIPVVNSHLTTGFKGASRSNSTQMTRRFDSTTATVIYNSTATNSNSYFVFANNTGSTATLFADARIAFYSIGESIDLAALDTRVSNLMTAIGAAIP